MENQLEMLVDAINELTTEVKKLNSGEIWGGTLVDALNQVAKEIKENK
tara:strand:+ start:67 stop:210 length:144 start_codon:yes stop_codon:yes gene_type:complete